MDKIQLIEKLFYHIVTYSYLLIPLCLISTKVRKKGVVTFILALYGLVCFICLKNFHDLPQELRKYYYTFYTSFEYTVFAFLFWKNITSSRFKQIVVTLSVLFVSFQIFYLLTSKGVMLDTIPIALETILTFTYIVYFFYEFSKNLTGLYIYNHYVFWIATGILIYLGISFFFFMLIDQLSEDQVNAFGILTYIAEIIKNILFVTALYVFSVQPSKDTNKKTPPAPFLDII